MPIYDPFIKLQKMNSGRSPKINWDHAMAEQKLRGSKVFVQLDRNKLVVYSEGVSSERIKEVMVNLGIDDRIFFQYGVDRNYCWIFQYTGNEVNPFCLPGQEKLVLLSICNHVYKSELKSGYVDTFARMHKILRPGREKVSSISKVYRLLNKKSDPFDDGLVIIDQSNVRIKVISKTSKLLSYIIDKDIRDISVRTMAEMVLMGDDVVKRLIAIRPDFAGPIGLVNEAYCGILREVSGVWAATRSSKNRSDFAYTAKAIIEEPNILKMLFDMRSGKVSGSTCLANYVKPENIVDRLQTEYGGTD